MVENENNETVNEEGGELSGGAVEQPAAETTGLEPAGAEVEGAATEDAATEPVAEEETDEVADDAPASEESSVDDAQSSEDDDSSRRHPSVPEVVTTRTLYFLQPDLPPVAIRSSMRFDRDDRDGDEERAGRRQPQGRGRGRREERVERADRRDRGAARRDRGSVGRDDADADAREDAPEVEAKPVLITEPQKIKGSTRLEAKRQRRREGRETGRRRPVVTESEFLARRESVDRVMLVRAKDGRVQIGVLEDKILVEHYVARSQESSLIGNVYLGRVQNVLPSMEAAFVDIGRGRNAVLYSGEVDWSKTNLGNQPRRIENALKPGDRVLVQVTKDPVGHKGARLTSQVSLPGRYLVYVPGNSMNGISRKLPDTERARLKKILKDVLPQGVGVIVRTAAEGATQEQLERDVNRLTNQWADISKRVESGPAPALLHSEPDLLIKIIRDVFNEDFHKLVIQGDEELEVISTYLRQVAPDLLDRVEEYEGDDVFAEYRATEHIEKALDRKVWLPSGGSLVIDRTEAMTVVDVNTGKFVGSGGNLEETVTKNNLEAAEEVVRQLRLRDIGGIIVIDFIDMVLESNRDLVLRRLVECLSRDRTKHQVAEVTSLGLVQMTRKKLGLGLLETFSEPCETCAGRGVVVYHDPVTKHRATSNDQGPSRGRRGRGGAANGQGGQNGQGGASNGGQSVSPSSAQGGQNGSSNGTAKSATKSGNGHNSTHGITDEARGALSKIAASTIKHDEAGHPHEAHVAEAGANGPDAAAASVEGERVVEARATASDPTDDQAENGEGQRDGGRRSRRSRRGRRGRGGEPAEQSADETPSAHEEPGRAGGGSRSILGIELPAASAEPQAPAPVVDLAALDSLLDGMSSAKGADEDAGDGADEPAAFEPASAEAEVETDGEPAEVEVEVVEEAQVVVEAEASEPDAEPEAPAAEEPAAEPVESRGASGRPRRRRITTGPLSTDGS